MFCIANLQPWPFNKLRNKNRSIPNKNYVQTKKTFTFHLLNQNQTRIIIVQPSKSLFLVFYFYYFTWWCYSSLYTYYMALVIVTESHIEWERNNLKKLTRVNQIDTPTHLYQCSHTETDRKRITFEIIIQTITNNLDSEQQNKLISLTILTHSNKYK